MFNGFSIDKKWLHDDCKGDFLKDIFDFKEDDKNMVLITHSNCINNLIELDGGRLIDTGVEDRETYGITVFYAVYKDEQQTYVLGYLYPDDWAKILSRESESLTKH